jgi:hypothetical protein
MTAGIMNLDVRYKDVESGEGIAVENITGIVRNAIGTVIEEITPVPLDDAEGVFYREVDYDTRDASKFFGTFITVEWKAQRYGVWIPTFEKRYYIDPVAEAPVDKTLVYWEPYVDADLFFYNVYRYRAADGEVFAGKSFSPSYVDDHPFENEFEARSWQYRIRPVTRTPGCIQDDGSDYVEQATFLTPYSANRVSNGTCRVYGSISNITGNPINFTDETIARSSIVFRINWRDRHQILGGTIITPEDVYVLPTSDGRFSVNLLWDAVVEMWIPPLNFRVRFLVPRERQVDFSTLEFEYVREK